MLNTIKLSTKTPYKFTTCPNHTGRLGSVYLTDATLCIHEVCYVYSQIFADVQIRQVGSIAVASVNQYDVHVDILRAVLEGSKNPQEACQTLAELHVLTVLLGGIHEL